MKILFMTDSYPPIINGVSVVVQKIAEYMTEIGNDVKVLTIRRHRSSPMEEEINEVSVKRVFGVSPGRSYHLPSPTILNELKTSFDVIHVHNFHSCIPLAYWISYKIIKQDGMNVLSPHYHVGGHHFHSKIAWLLYKPLLRKAIKDFDVVQCVSTIEAQRLHLEFDVDPLVIENGVDEDVYRFKWMPSSNDNLNVITIGRLEKYKHIDVLIKAAHILKERGFSIQIDLVGSGPEASYLENLAMKLDVKIRFFRYLPRDQMLSLLSRSSCLVNTSHYEAYSLVTADAIAIGVPVVITYPWGVIFQKYSRVVLKDPTPLSVAEGILDAAMSKSISKNHVPTWNDVGKEIYEKIYLQHLCPDVRNG